MVKSPPATSIPPPALFDWLLVTIVPVRLTEPPVDKIPPPEPAVPSAKLVSTNVAASAFKVPPSL